MVSFLGSRFALLKLVFLVTQNDATNTDDCQFKDIVNCKHYVDKTGFIKHLHVQENPIFFSAPRHFGKTLFLSMLKTFYEINVDENGAVLQKTSTQNFKAFSKLANKANINSSVFKDDIFFKANFGSRPVVFLSLKHLNFRNVAKFLDSFETMMFNLYNKYIYVIKSNKLDSADEKHFRSYCDAKVKKNEQSLLTSGQTLTGILFRYFKKQCVVLIDDFDTPVMNMLSSVSEDENKIFHILENFFRFFFNENGAVEKVFMVGNTELARGYLKGVDNVEHYSFAKDEIAKLFGFTEEEVRHLIKDSNLDLKEIRRFYGGYRVAKSAVRLYNPYSVGKFLEFQKPKIYWSATEKMNLNLLFRREGLRKLIDDAIAGGGVVIECSEEMMENLELSTLQNLLTSPVTQQPLEAYQRDFLGQFFWDLGYLTDLKDIESNFVELVSPNLEVRITLSEILAKSWMHFYGTELRAVEDYTNAFMDLANPTDSTYKAFEKSVNALFSKSVLPQSEFGLASTLHSFLLYSPKQYTILDIITINGRANLLVCQRPQNKAETGLILGFRHKNCRGESLLKDLRDAGYEDIFEEDEYKNIARYILVGICLNKAKKFDLSFFAKKK